jgi:hypothetical protein
MLLRSQDCNGDKEDLQNKKSSALLRHFVLNFKLSKQNKYSRNPAKILSILRNGQDNDPKSREALKQWKFLKKFQD